MKNRRRLSIALCITLVGLTACYKMPEVMETRTDMKGTSTEKTTEGADQIIVVETEDIAETITDTEEVEVLLPYTYTTRFGEMNQNGYPDYSFGYSDNWEVTTEDCDSRQETITLTNDRGVEIIYTHFYADESETFEYGGGYEIIGVEINEVSDSDFVPGVVQERDYSELGEFMVAEIVRRSIDDGLTGEVKPLKGSFFAVLPKQEAGSSYYKTLIEAEFSFYYGAHISFICASPDLDYTEEEEKEIIAILSSFRVSDSSKE